MAVRYMYKLFKTKEEAKAFQKELGKGVIYNLEAEKRKKPSAVRAVVLLDCDIVLTDEDKYSVEWNEVFDYE